MLLVDPFSVMSDLERMSITSGEYSVQLQPSFASRRKILLVTEVLVTLVVELNKIYYQLKLKLF
jgi:hypothetical protein